MADDQWLLKEDGYLNVDTDSRNIIYHSNLNVILVFTKNNEIKVLDINSGVVLQTCCLSVDGRTVNSKYMSKQDKVLFWDSKNIGLRSDYNGVLLLDTILQTPVLQTDDLVKIELLLSEAVLFLQSLQSLEEHGLENTADVTNELTAKIEEAQAINKKGIKAQKWNTICLELPHSSLKILASNVVFLLKKFDRHIPALAIASAINERLTDLLVGGRMLDAVNSGNSQRFLMYAEATRRQTFARWPHMDYKWALPNQMAQAGFYHQPSVSGDDRAMCFTCNVCLVCWEKTDEPWSEHERHSQNCPFVKGEYTQNVPLAVTYATDPAVSTSGFTIMSNGTQSNVICTGDDSGKITLWKIKRQIKKLGSIKIRDDAQFILSTLNTENIQECDIKLHSICTYRSSDVTSKAVGNCKGLKVVCGVSMNKEQYLVVYNVFKSRFKAIQMEKSNDEKLNDTKEDNSVDATVNKKSSLKNIIPEEQYDVEFVPAAAVGSNKFTKGFGHWKQWNPTDELFQFSAKNNQSNNDDELYYHKVYSDLSEEFSTIKEKQENTKNNANNIASTSTATSFANSDVTGVSCFAVQSIAIVPLLNGNYVISEIIPSYDHKLLLIVLRKTKDTYIQNKVVKMDVDGEEEQQTDYTVDVQLFVYQIKDDGFIVEQPICARVLFEDPLPIQICMLPSYNYNSSVESDTQNGVFAMVCKSGTLQLLALTSLRTISETSVDEKFVSVTYCKNLERICACTSTGFLHFYSFYDIDMDSSDEQEDEKMNLIASDTSLTGGEHEISETDGLNQNPIITSNISIPSTSNSPLQTNSTENATSSSASGSIYAHKNDLTLNDLKVLYSLTLFDEMLTPFSAEVPACWNEFVQAQKQRRHPQNLRPGDDTHLIKTFRLHNDATTWDEHIIEITLPKPAALGHIDLKFSLYQQCPNPPAIQVTLLKQNTSGFGYRMKAPVNNVAASSDSSVDENIDFKIEWADARGLENPVLSEEYLQSHNADIISGPIELSSCMDLSEQGGLVTFTSPKLFKTKSRNFLIHVKTMVEMLKEGQGKTRVPVRKKGILRCLFPSIAKPSSQNSANGSYSHDSSASKSRNNEFYIGCDWLHEIALSVRSTKNIFKISNERFQRTAMLESNILLGNLLNIASKTELNIQKNIALDILIWIISIRLTRYRSPKTEIQNQSKATNLNELVVDMHLQQIDCVNIVQANLTELLRNCILQGNRSTANKCVKIILITSEGAHNMPQERIERRNFESSLKNSVLTCIPDLIIAKHAGALRWFTLLISGTSTVNSQGQIAEKCVELLLKTSQEIGQRWNQYTSLLRTRFGLYGLPFEPDLFDAELALSTKYNALPNTLASIIKNAASAQQQNTAIDLKKFCATDGTELRTFPSQIRRKGISNQLRGLLEVEPLHFSCCAASEATRVENMDTAAVAQTTNIMEDVVFETTPQNNTEVTSANNIEVQHDNKKNTGKDHEADDDFMKNFKNILVDKFFYSAIQKQKIKDSSKINIQANANNTEKSSIMVIKANDQKSEISNSYLNEADLLSLNNILEVIHKSMDKSEHVVMHSLSNKIQEFMTNNCFDDNSTSIPWHKLLSLPPKQMIVVDRMHSGARRFITLDFGSPIMLTDVVIPACEDLVSLFIDIWCFEEEADSIRLVVAADIATKTLVLSDLQPPPICRFMKITTTGRYGMSATRCKIPIGSFFGHVLVLENDGYADPVLKYIKPKNSNIPTQLKALNSLYEDVHCRYSLSSSKLTELLDPLFNSDISNVAHMQAYLNKNKDYENGNIDQARILNVYEECITFQHQLNIIQNVIQRLDTANNSSIPLVQLKIDNLATISSDKLRVLSECLVEILLHLIIEYGVKNVISLHPLFNLNTCNTLFNTLVVCGDNNMQLATCSLLVRMCCFQPWWGEFLATTFTKLYSSQNSKIFPQDRVFFLLTYLGRKSITMGSCRTIVIDAILKTLATLLVPLSTYASAMEDQGYHNDDITGSKTDFQLISWLLLFLSVCLDDGLDKKEQSALRWDFMSGEADISKARAHTTNNGGRSFSRSFKKRFLQNKQTNITSSLSDKIYMIQNDKTMQKNKLHQLPEIFMEMTGNGKGKPKSTTTKANNTTKQKDPLVEQEQAFDKGLKSLKTGNVLVVIRGLLGLLLAMDYTCNMDLFLLTCKIIARLVSACRPSIQLSKIITTAQLQQLVRLAVWKDQQQPWAVHAITCLLQDILEADKNFRLNNSDDDIPSEMDVVIENIEAAGSSETFSEQLITENVLSEATKEMNYADTVKCNHLPSLMECEDAEMDDILDDILERGKNLMKNDSSNFNRAGLSIAYKSVSSAMDARLDYGLETNVEVNLRRLTMMSSLNLFASLPQIQQINETLNTVVEIPPWPDHVMQAWSGPEYNQGISKILMFVLVFDNIFADLYLQDSWLNLEQVLQLWLTLNSELSEKGLNAGFNSSEAPKIPFGPNAVQGLLSALAWHMGITLRSWSLGFQCLTLACNPHLSYELFYENDETNETNPRRMGVFIVNNPNFEKMLLRFYSSTDMSSAGENRCAGPTICKLIHELFVWMEIKSDVMDMCYLKKKLKEILLRVVLQLVQPGGAISMQQGPIDAQNLLIKELITFQYEKTDLGVAMSIIESVSYLVHSHISNVEKVYCQRLSDANNTNNVFGSLFATVLGSDNSRQNKTVSDNSLLVCLLKLSSKLVQTTLPRRAADESMTANDTISVQNVSIESQTDEIKAEQQHQPEPPTIKIPCVADTVLQHYPTMTRLLGSLSQSSSSSFALLASSLYPINPDTNNSIGDPTTVADAVFQILMLLSRKATQPTLVIKPLYDFLNSTSNIRHALPKLQLSEPFLWFVLKVLDTPATVTIFTEMGGIKVLCQSLVRSNKTLINMQPGLVSLIMQHVSKSLKQKTASTSTTNCKKSSISSKSSDGLINFAPFCSISTENSTAQPPDVLIQAPIASHRRARTPTWTYLFYPNESHIDLVVTLPTAILLKEIQLQPHLPSLASSPSAVALEINRDNSLAPIPISQPISTVGLTCIQLKLPQPEIASSIVLRLYRPKDSTSIGLTQISILGTTVFTSGKNIGQDSLLCEDDTAAKSSLGWLRILARCFSVATFNVEDQSLPNAVIQSAADYPGFLEACCSLLNVTTAGPSIALQNLETVLLKLGLHSKELGLKLIENLFKSTLPQTFRLGNEAVSDLLYDLCTTKDNFTCDRIGAMIEWTKNLYNTFHQQKSLLRTNPYSGFVKCLSSILWTVYTSDLCSDLASLITEDLFNAIFVWTEVLEHKEPLKGAIDSMLCSFCCIRPELFPYLLKKMNVLVPNLSTDIHASISDDRKDTEGMTDDTKQAASNTGEWYSHLVIQDLTKLTLTSSQLKTIAMACQSELAVHQLLDSGLPKLLSFAILEFCLRVRPSKQTKDPKEQSNINLECLTDSDKVENKILKNTYYPLVNVDMIAEILGFFSETCSEGHMRDWLGSYEGSVFWNPLLDLLCNDKPIESTSELSSSYSKLEAATIKFLSKVTSCHPKNQENLTVILISVIKKPNNHVNSKNIISGFTRRLVLQLLLESERILISVRSDVPLQKRDCFLSPINNHPSKRPNTHHILFYLSTHTKCQEILENCVYNNLLSSPSVLGELTAKHAAITEKTCALIESRKELLEFGLGIGSGMEFLSVAAGVTAKDKRLKDARNQVEALNAKDLFPLITKFKNTDNFTSTTTNTLTHLACPGVLLSSDTTISQILAMLHTSGISLATPCITLNLVQSPNKIDDITDESQTKAANLEPLHSPLQVFSSRGGLSLLAHYLPTVYPENPKTLLPYTDKEKSPPASEWVKVEPNDDIYEDIEDTLTDSASKIPINLSVPQHSLAAFGLFLRLPAYSDVLLKDKIKAQCLLRLVLGVTGDGEGNEIYSLSLASSLPTLPFEVFRQLLDCSPLTTDDGVLLRRMVIEVGAMHLVLNCLGIFTHHSQMYQLTGVPTETQANSLKTGTNNDEPVLSDDKSHVYWAKGTGFGTGSTQQSWDVEQALLRQKSEEEHVTVLLQILSSYINPGDNVSAILDPNEMVYHEVCEVSAELPPIFLDLIQHSCLIPALSSYLRNDSVLDITRHIPLYRAILQLLRAVALSNQLVSLLMHHKREEGSISIALLLLNMKTCVDTYASRLKVNKKSNIKGQTQKVVLTLDDGDDEGLALLIPDIQETTLLVQRATNIDAMYSISDDEQANIDRPLSLSIEQRYLELMKKLQFDTSEMIVECENGYRFAISHHFENNVRMAGDRSHPTRVKRLAQETVTLSTSLPLSYSSSVFVRCDNDRLDIMKVLITGPAETPYANGCFEFDVYFPPDYPNSPMMINLETTGRHTVRFNPNLYNDGKVCLSVLNTWHGRPEEKWNAQTSSFLQVLVSIQSLILVPEPYFNEPGFERSRGTPSGTHSSKEYNSNIYQASVRWAMLEQIKNPCPCFKQIIHTHFWLKRQEICTQIEDWIAELNKPQTERSGRTISFNSMVLRRQYRQLREELAKLPVPEGLEDLERPFTANITSPTITFDSSNTATNLSLAAQQETTTTSASSGHLEDTSISSAVFDSNNSSSDSNTPNIQIDFNDAIIISINEII